MTTGRYIIIIGLIGSFIGLAITYFNRQANYSDDYKIQISNLSEVEKSLESLTQFIREQKKRVEVEQKAFEDLQYNRNKLEKLVKADQEIVESIFRIQEKRQRSSKWIERSYGFFTGILSSIFATLILKWTSKKRPSKVKGAN